MNDIYDVYICNSSIDKQIAGDLREHLISNGLHPFMAPYDVPAGVLYAEAVMQAINKCPVFIVIVSDASCKSMRVLNEIYEAARSRTRFIPFRIDDTPMPAGMRYYLQAYGCINGVNKPKEQFEELFRAVLSNLPPSRRQEIETMSMSHQSSKTPTSSAIRKRIFVSYSSKDKKKVFPIVQRIEQGLGLSCWIDTSGIMSAEHFIGEIRKAIDASEIMLYMYSDNAAKSPWTMKEINYAHSKGKRIIPIVLEGDSMKGDFAFMFSDVNFVPISQEDQETKLLKDLAKMLGITIKDKEIAQNATTDSQHEKADSTIGDMPMASNDTSIDMGYLNRWNWGAALLYPIWGIFNGCWWAVLPSFVLSIVGLSFSILVTVILMLIFGIYGSRWAWKYGKYKSFQQFREKQRYNGLVYLYSKGNVLM